MVPLPRDLSFSRCENKAKPHETSLYVFKSKLNISQYTREDGAKLRFEEMGQGCYLFNHKELQGIKETDTTLSSMSTVI